MVFSERYLSFSSSGSYGFVFEGFVRAVEDHAPTWLRDLRGVAGTSGGAIMALVVALGIGREAREDLVARLCDITNVVRRPDVSLMVRDFGMEDGSALRGIVEDILTRGGLSRASTLRDLRRLLRLEVVFVAHDLHTCRAVHLSADSEPDMPVADAVFASCAVPLVFAPLRAGGRALCDGALSECVPDVFPDAETLSVIVVPFYEVPSLQTWFDFLAALLRTNFVAQRPRIEAMQAGPRAVAYDLPDAGPSLRTVDRRAYEQMLRVGYAGGAARARPDTARALGRRARAVAEGSGPVLARTRCGAMKLELSETNTRRRHEPRWRRASRNVCRGTRRRGRGSVSPLARTPVARPSRRAARPSRRAARPSRRVPSAGASVSHTASRSLEQCRSVCFFFYDAPVSLLLLPEKIRQCYAFRAASAHVGRAPRPTCVIGSARLRR